MRGEPVTGEPSRSFPTRLEWGTTLQEHRDRAGRTAESLTVFSWDPELIEGDQGWDGGFLAGNANLLVDLQPGYGYHAAGNKAWSYYGCVLHLGNYNPFPPCSDRYFEPVPGLPGTTWIELMTSDEVLLSPLTPERVVEHFETERGQTGQVGPYARYLRDDGLPGRVTATRGEVVVTATDRPPTGAAAVDGYRVDTTAGAGELVLRIPWWPGIEAEAGGRPVEVSSLDETLTVVRLPAGLRDTDLDISYRPIGERVLLPSLAVGTALVLLAVLLGGLRPLRRGRSRAQR
jgi:hypothetical protein